MTSISLQDFERYSSKRAVQASLRRAKISEEGTYEEFVGQLYDDIDQLIYRMQGGPELRQTDSEDRLSAEVLGGLSILLGYKVKYGAWLIVIFLVPVTLALHNFWAVQDPMQAQLQMAMFMKNIALLGGALLLAYFGPGPYSVEHRA